MPSIIIFVVLLLFGFVSVDKIFAQVVINEVFPNPSGPSSEPDEFIELINTGEEAVDVSGWIISDTQGLISTFSIPDSTVIEKGSFLSFPRSMTGISLNNSSDGVVIKDIQGTVIDEIAFGAIEENISYGLFPDGNKENAGNMTPTENSPNSVLIAPTPTQTPIPTRTPTPTKTMTPTKIPTNTATPSIIKLDEEKNDNKEADVLSAKSLDQNKNASSSSANRFVGDAYEDDSIELSDLDSGKQEAQILGTSDTNSGSIAVIGGSVLLLSACGILLFQKYKYIFLR